jgi:hypothetical protein
VAESYSATAANEFLDAVFNADAYSVAEVWVKLHVGAPGSAGTSNAATETTRKQLSCAAAAGGDIASDATLTWTNVAGTEDYTHFSLWTASSGGTFLGSGTITANAVTAGDTFTIASGSFTISLAEAS